MSQPAACDSCGFVLIYCECCGMNLSAIGENSEESMDGYPGSGTGTGTLGAGTSPGNKGLLQRGQASTQQHDRGQISVEMECRMKLQAQLRDSIGALESSIEAVLAPSSPTTPGEASSHRDLTPARHVEYLAEGNRDLHSLIIWVDSIRQRVEL